MTRSARSAKPSATSETERLIAPRVQRKCKSCGARASSIDNECEECAAKHRQDQLKGTHVGPMDDALEREADQVADRVVRGATTQSPNPLSSHMRSASPRDKSDRREVEPPRVTPPAGAGAALEGGTRAIMEERFGRDFADVRIHTDVPAAQSASAIGSRAYTAGRDIYFAHGEFNPQRVEGRHLIAHELAHTVQQRSGATRLQRKPAPKPSSAPQADPLCAGYDHKATLRVLQSQIKDYLASKERLLLIRCLKMVRRCATTEEVQQVRTQLDAELGADAQAIWEEAGTAFGGYTGFYPGFAPDIKKHLEKLGTTETMAASSFELSGSGATHRTRATAKGRGEVADLGRADVVYFRGHQYAQYRAPGLFANGDETHGFDLRYVEKVGGFSNVKIMISTSCATLCKEALDVFTSLFPNAVILGYRKSAPIQGAAVREALRDGINALNKPLLLDQPVDVDAIISVWKSVIESKHKGETAPVPGYYAGGNVHYWDGSSWGVISPSDPANTCRRKGDFSSDYPAPP